MKDKDAELMMEAYLGSCNEFSEELPEVLRVFKSLRSNDDKWDYIDAKRLDADGGFYTALKDLFQRTIHETTKRLFSDEKEQVEAADTYIRFAGHHEDDFDMIDVLFDVCNGDLNRFADPDDWKNEVMTVISNKEEMFPDDPGPAIEETYY